MANRRIGAVIIVACLVSGGLSLRLFSVSVVQHKQYLALADEQQQTSLDILPQRGDIYMQDASSGKEVLLAQSVERFALSVTPKDVTKKEAYAKVLAKYSGLAEADILKDLQQNSQYLPPLKHGLTKANVDALAVDLNAVEKEASPGWQNVNVNFDTNQGDTLYFIGGVYFTREYDRVYPEGSLLGQTVGFVNNEGKGQYGIEGEFNSELKGTAGTALYETDSQGTLLSEQSAISGKNGTTYNLTIDRNVQYEVEQDLAQELKDSEAKGGTVIVMNPKTGAIMAMASQPSYDPNNFQDVTSSSLFDNPAISNNWEPGSIFKPLVMSAALDLGLVTPDTSNDFPESVTVQGNKIETALRRAYGVETMTQVISNSDNVAMVWLANKLGNQNMYNYLQKFGIGQATGVDLANEISGDLPDVKTWQDIDRATISFGQGVAATPLQMTTAFAAIANNGKMVQPHIIASSQAPGGPLVTTPVVEGAQVIKPQTAKDMLGMMVYTVNNADKAAGTSGYQIGGKTGTAQVPDPVNGGYIADAYNHSFVGIGPANDPQYVILVKIDQPNTAKVGLYAEDTAVPLAGKLSTFLLHYYQVPPTGPVSTPTPTPEPTPTPTPIPTPSPSNP